MFYNLGTFVYTHKDFETDFKQYNYDLCVWTYGLILPIEGSFEIEITPRILVLDRSALVFDVSSEVTLSITLKNWLRATSLSPSSGVFDLSIDFVSSFTCASCPKVEGTLSYTLPCNFRLYANNISGAQLNLVLRLTSSFFTNIYHVAGILWKDTSQLKLNLAFNGATLVGFIKITPQLNLSLVSRHDLTSTLDLQLLPSVLLTGYIRFITDKNIIVVNLNNASVSEWTVNGMPVTYNNKLYLFNRDGIFSEGDGFIESYARFKLENIEDRYTGRWTDLYLIGEAELDLLCNSYTCEVKSTMREFSIRYRLPFGIRTRDLTIELNGKIKYIDYLDIERLKIGKTYNFTKGRRK